MEGSTVMKRLLSLLLILTLMTSALVYSGVAFADDEDDDPVDLYFGGYQQELPEDYPGDSAIEWMLLDFDEKTSYGLFISFYALDAVPFDAENNATSWNDSSIRKWLNNDFLNLAFSEAEQKAIVTTTVDNGKDQNNPEWDTSGSNSTEDKIFLLSAAEYLEYFPFKEKCPYTPYAQEMAGKIFKETGTWWLRSPGKKTGEFSVADKGEIGSLKQDKVTGICPAVWIDCDMDPSEERYFKLVAAEEIEASGDYMKAFDVYCELGRYEYADYSAAGTLLEYAAEAYDNNDYENTISRLNDYFEFCTEEELELNEDYYELSSEELLNDSLYQLARVSEENGDYEDAIASYSLLGQYKDSFTRIFACFDATHINYQLISSDKIDLVNAGINTGYSKTDIIDKGDPHNGWKIGSFFVSGFTEVEDGDTPVFLKKPGDNLELWFSLEQNIEALNGNDKLSIMGDKKGQDSPFQYPTQPTDFGRGALLVKHITSKTEKTNIYTNYLAAKESDGANTRIELKEEGTYYIALDYIIKDKSLTKALKSTDGYRLSFQFKVKNANGLAYPQDLESGMELQNYGWTENGFKINFANSKSLQVDVIRYGLNQTGNALDVRSNAPASERDAFGSIGYYVVTMINTETGNTTEKHLFVGTEEDLDSYIAADASLAAFKG